MAGLLLILGDVLLFMVGAGIGYLGHLAQRARREKLAGFEAPRTAVAASGSPSEG